MKHCLDFRYLKPLFLAGLFASALWGAGADPVRVFDPATPLRFELRERTKLSSYWWPQTLLSYPVRFTGHVSVARLAMRDVDSGSPVPFQLSRVESRGGNLQFAVVHFLSDLPSGGSRNFELFVAESPGPRSAPEAVRVTKAPGTVTLDSGTVSIRLPDSGKVTTSVPGPVSQIGFDGKWFGTSKLVSPKRKVLAIETKAEESGPVFAQWRVSYQLEGGALYSARIRVIAGYDHIQLREEASGIEAQDKLYWEAAWTGFSPTHRHAPNHPFLTRPQDSNKSPFDQIPWERVDEGFVNTQHGVSPGISEDGELPFRLGPYQPWGAYVILTSACFWDDKTNQSLGVFIDRLEDWQDNEYAIWSASNTMQVRYYYRDGQLSWQWPIVTGTRSTGIAAYSHDKDVESINRLVRGEKTDGDGVGHKLRMFPASHTQFLQNRYGTLDLNMVKDWVLAYGDGPRDTDRIFTEGSFSSPGQLMRSVLSSELAIGMMSSGTRQNSGFSPVPARKMYDSYTDGLHRLWPQLDESQRERLAAWYLMFSYVAAGEDWLPMQTMLAGHPNFLSDVKSVPALTAFLFPSHPMASEWADVFEKFLELDTRYHTRPEVNSWEARGGRWTENLGTYVWAFLRPAVRAEFLLRKHFDGKNRIANPQIAQIADWALNALSAPFDGEDLNFYRDSQGRIPPHYWGVVTKENGPRRLHPPQGAHSARRMPPRVLWWLGDSLQNYDPLLAEGLMWASRPGDDDSEHMKDATDPWGIMYPREDNRGTNPHLASSKYTGYGVTLRAGVDTPEEVSVHLQQIDEGPNYRWGVAGEGGNGVIYYYASGKSYSHNGREDVGDRPTHDTDFSTNFGVWKDGRFKSVGRNVLERPLYDLGGVQFSEILPRSGAGGYSWPEYQGRSILMAGSDYIVVYDDVFNDAVANRFSWMTHAAETLPGIQMVRGGTRDRRKHAVRVQTDEIHGIWYDGLGDAMTVVSHKPGFKAERTPYGCTVVSPDGVDHVFRDPDGIDYNSAGIAFRGTSGIIRRRGSANFEMALFQGSRVAAGGADVTLSGKDMGLSMQFSQPEKASGFYFGRQGGTVTIACARCSSGIGFYVDGKLMVSRAAPGGLSVDLGPGRHRWQLTKGLPIPVAPAILRTENSSGKALVVWNPASGAERYTIQLSEDNGQSWRPVGETAATRFSLSGLQNGHKYHARLLASNTQRTSAPGHEYPIYPTSKEPAHPDGLRLSITGQKVSLTWGQVLGTGSYRLYRRIRGEKDFREIYAGNATSFIDEPEGIRQPFDRPGVAANAVRRGETYIVYEYAVSAVNGNGEGERSVPVSTDPTSWVNWDPRPGELFRRRFTYNTTNYLRLGAEEDHARYYPK